MVTIEKYFFLRFLIFISKTNSFSNDTQLAFVQEIFISIFFLLRVVTPTNDLKNISVL